MGMTDAAMECLKTLGIKEVVYSLSGSGDSGDSTLESVVTVEGCESSRLPNISLDFTDQGSVMTVNEIIGFFAEGLPEGDWVNNDGGQGSVTLLPQEEDEDCRTIVDMEYNDEGGDFDEEDFEEDPDDGDDPDQTGPDEVDRAEASGASPKDAETTIEIDTTEKGGFTL